MDMRAELEIALATRRVHAEDRGDDADLPGVAAQPRIVGEADERDLRPCSAMGCSLSCS